MKLGARAVYYASRRPRWNQRLTHHYRSSRVVHEKNRKGQGTVLASYRTSFTASRRIRRTVVIVQFFHRKVFVKGESNNRHGHAGGWFRRL